MILYRVMKNWPTPRTSMRPLDPVISGLKSNRLPTHSNEGREGEGEGNYLSRWKIDQRDRTPNRGDTDRCLDDGLYGSIYVWTGTNIGWRVFDKLPEMTDDVNQVPTKRLVLLHLFIQTLYDVRSRGERSSVTYNRIISLMYLNNRTQGTQKSYLT